jgi:plastocyanin
VGGATPSPTKRTEPSVSSTLTPPVCRRGGQRQPLQHRPGQGHQDQPLHRAVGQQFGVGLVRWSRRAVAQERPDAVLAVAFVPCRLVQAGGPALDSVGSSFGRSAPFASKEPVMRCLFLAIASACLTVTYAPSPAEAQAIRPRPVDSSTYQSTVPSAGTPGSSHLTTPATAPSGINLSTPYAMPPYVRVVDVGLYDNSFLPGIVYIQAGTVVRWTNRSDRRHTVTSDEGLWDSGELRPGEGYAVYFPLPGTYYYHCRMHARDMRAWVVVRGGY